MTGAPVRVVGALGTAQTLAWASSYYLPAMLAAPMAADLGVATPTVFAVRPTHIEIPVLRQERHCMSSTPIHHNHMEGITPAAFADLPNIDPSRFNRPSPGELFSPPRATHAPRFLLLYGSLRERSYSRLVAEESARLLQALGGETRIFNPSGLPLVDDASDDHPKVRELHELVQWSEGMVWSSPERHGAMTGLMKTQIDWIPLSVGAVRPTQGKTLAVMQVSGGSQSFNAVNQMRVLGRWMRMLTIPNQSSVAKAYQEFDDAGRMKPSPYYDRIVDVVEELMKFTLLTRDVAPYLVDRYSERKETAAALSHRMRQASI